MIGQIEQLLRMIAEGQGYGPPAQPQSQLPGDVFYPGPSGPTPPQMPFRPPMQQGPAPPVNGQLAQMFGGR